MVPHVSTDIMLDSDFYKLEGRVPVIAQPFPLSDLSSLASSLSTDFYETQNTVFFREIILYSFKHHLLINNV